MRQPEADSATPEVWLQYAEADLKVANLLEGHEDMAPIIAFHSQQAAEKALKGYLARLGDEAIPRTHDLKLLAGRVVGRGGQEPPREGIAVLSSQAVVPRYPTADPPTPGEAAHARDLAEQVVTFVREAIGETEGPGAQNRCGRGAPP